MRSGIRSLRSMKYMPLPHVPIVRGYGEDLVGHAHDIHLFPACIREKKTIRAEEILEEGQSSCFFHPKFPANAVCEVSGRMICDLCSTEWEGQTVSFEALKSLVAQGGSDKSKPLVVKWDDVALALAVLPLLLWPITLITAPAVLVVSIWHWRRGPTSIVRRSRWRYIVAVLLATLQIIGWVLLLVLNI